MFWFKNKVKYHINKKKLNKGVISNPKNKKRCDKVQVLAHLFLHAIFSNRMTNDCQLICGHVAVFMLTVLTQESVKSVAYLKYKKKNMQRKY